jgi:heme oxygenase
MRAVLRAGVAGLHARLDRAIAATCLGEPPDLWRLLGTHHAALGLVVPALERGGAARLLPGWEGRSRLAALAADLAELRAGPPPPPPAGGAGLRLAGEPEVWGALYAVEDSRLGNRVLLRRVGRRATRFLAHRPEDAAAAWPRLVARLDALDCRGADCEAALRGARAVFGLYLAAAERHGCGHGGGDRGGGADCR